MPANYYCIGTSRDALVCLGREASIPPPQQRCIKTTIKHIYADPYRKDISRDTLVCLVLEARANTPLQQRYIKMKWICRSFYNPHIKVLTAGAHCYFSPWRLPPDFARYYMVDFVTYLRAQPVI